MNLNDKIMDNENTFSPIPKILSRDSNYLLKCLELLVLETNQNLSKVHKVFQTTNDGMCLKQVNIRVQCPLFLHNVFVYSDF